MVVLNGKISGFIGRNGTSLELNGRPVHEHSNGSKSPGHQYQEVASVLKNAHRELERILEQINEHAETTAETTAIQAIQTNTAQYNLSTRNGSSVPEKRFDHRQSVLTDMFATPHLRTTYNIAVIIFLILLFNDFAVDYVIKGEPPKFALAVGMLWTSFTGFHRALGIWMVMKLATVFTYAGFTWWARQRSYLISTTRLAFDYFCIAAIFGYLSLFCYLPVWRMRLYDLGISSVAAVLMEQVRLLMKMIAFIRSNVPRALEATKEPITEDEDDDEEDASKLRRKAYPGFSNFLFFLFAPTAVYRDSYPRTKRIRWGYVATSFLEVVSCVILDAFLLEKFILPQTRAYGREIPAGITSIVTIHVSSMLTVFLMTLAGHYCLFHAWLNAFAEMLRFGDRLFYLDWWNQKDYSSWFRTWNLVIQDWLFTYVYRDVAILTRSKNLAKISVFIVSSLFHEYILALTFQFSLPLQMVMFALVGGTMALLNLRITSSLGNIFLLASWTMGNTALVVVYSIEYYARFNCGKTLNDPMDVFFPRALNCVNATEIS